MEIIEKILIAEGFIEKTLETISAFENSKGGTIYLFKKDSSEIKNAELLSSLNEAKSNIQKQMLNSNVLVPSLLLEGNFSLEKVEGKTELKITVPAAPASMRPVTFNGRVIKYGKNGNYIANASEIEAMKNDADGYAIDHEILPRVMPEDIFGEAYAEFREAFAELHGFWSELNDID
ncbi:MAG: ATP-binding protein, partial [Bacilli bacterium]|nr:ATP-binding protein [Bacilli bacterium]